MSVFQARLTACLTADHQAYHMTRDRTGDGNKQNFRMNKHSILRQEGTSDGEDS